MIAQPFHAGEQALQQRAGSAARLAEMGPHIVRDVMPLQHREFFESQPYVVAGTVDGAGRPWASLLVGMPGFMRSPDAQTLVIGALPLEGDPIAGGLHAGAPIGLLGIETATRRRNRMNGRIASVDARGIRVAVGQSFGNCPKYIHARVPRFVRGPGATQASAVEGFTSLDGDAQAMIAAADTFFVATHAPGDGPSRGADVSHRGGPPGFVKVEDDATLLVPDFAGNRFFMTLGNLLLDARAGLVFVDFERGDLLCLTGRTEIVEHGPELAVFENAERAWRFHLREGRCLRDALPLRWDNVQERQVSAS